MQREYYFNIGVKPYDFDPPAAMAFMPGFIDSGNGVYVIPFTCEEVPKGYKPYQADSTYKEDTETTCCRRVIKSIGLKSLFVHFKSE